MKILKRFVTVLAILTIVPLNKINASEIQPLKRTFESDRLVEFAAG